MTNTVVISVTDVNDQTPTFSATAGAINYAEGATTAVDSFTITDTDTTGTLACAESGADASLFSCAISGSTLTVSWDASPDFETQADADSNGIYVYTITVGDGTNDANPVTYTITVTDVVIDISAASATIDETASNGAAVVTLASTGDSATNAGFTISAGNANGAFAVTPQGAVTVADTTAIDYETATSQTVTFTITDGSNPVTEEVVITFNNNAIAITDSQTASIAENTGTGNAIMTVATTGDSMAGNSWQITNGNSGGQFAIAAGTGVISNAGTALDYDTDTSHTLTVSVSDGSNAVTNTVVISVTDVNDQTPTFSATAGAINYAEGATTAVDSFTITDTDTTGTLACAESGADASLFSCGISGTTLTVSWDAST